MRTTARGAAGFWPALLPRSGREVTAAGPGYRPQITAPENRSRNFGPGASFPALSFSPSPFHVLKRNWHSLLAQSPGPVVRLPATCTMMDWQPLTDYRKSELNGEMLEYWGIIKTKKLYYQQ